MKKTQAAGASATGSQESNNIRVVCRCRPLNKLEIELGGEQCVKIIDSTNVSVQIAGEESPHQFTFDKIFSSDTRQIDVFQEVGQPVLDIFMKGINSTIFAYGQTSSGKTHTMEGKHDDPEYKGLIPRMMERLFDMITEAPSSIEFSIKASFLEIYNEKIQDLLDTSKTNLNVKEDKLRGIFVADATEAFVVKAADMMKVMRKGTENRSVAATRMNERSSRSHSIFLLTLIQKDTLTGTSKLSKLYFVDLAGSEKIAKTNVTGQQLEEAKNINKSLTCLGIVINSLSEKKDFIPYRDSKLTRILQESIGGNSKTTLIIACSMCSYNDKETVGTLRFGQRAKSIKNQAKVNEEKSAKELMQLLSKADTMLKHKDEVIAALQVQLGLDHSLQLLQNINPIVSTGGVTPISETIGSAQTTNRKMLEQNLEIMNLKERIEELTGEKNDLSIDNSNKSVELSAANEKIKQLQEQVEKEQLERKSNSEKLMKQIESIKQEQIQSFQSLKELSKSSKRLSTDLGFLLVSIKVDSKEYSSSEQPIFSAIRSALQEIESITNALCSSSSIEQQIDKFESDQGKQKTIEGHLYTLTRNDSFKNKPFLSPRSCQNAPRLSCKQSSSCHVYLITDFIPIIIQQESTCDYNEVLSTEADDRLLSDDELAPFSQLSCSIYQTNNNNALSGDNGLILEEQEQEESENFDEADIQCIMELTRYLNEFTETQKLELQTFIISLKKSVRKLEAANSEVNLNLSRQRSINESITMKFQKKLSEIKKRLIAKIKETEGKLAQVQTQLIEKQSEIVSVNQKNEKQLLDKNQQLTNLKVEFDNLKKMIQSNHPASKISELSLKVKELATDRQKLFNDLFMARKDLDEKEVTLKENETTIASLTRQLAKQQQQSPNLNANTGSLDFLQNIKQGANEVIISPRATIVDRRLSIITQNGITSTAATSSSSSSSAPANSSSNSVPQTINQTTKKVSLKSHIAPCIRGGDGDQASYQKNNQFLFENNFFDDIPSPKSGSSSPFSAPVMSPRSSPGIPASSSRSLGANTGGDKLKLENGLQLHQVVVSSPRRYMNQIEEEEDMAQDFASIEPTKLDMRKSFKNLNQVTLKQEKPQSSSFFGAVKKIFM